MAGSRKVLCVSTSKPSTALTPGGGGGSLTIVCPQTGSLQSSLRVAGDLSGKAALGISTFSLFPSKYSSPTTSLATGFGSNSTKSDDSYGMLFTLRSASLPPILHWKTRLPEAQMSAGLLVSPCGTYVAGGGTSGTLYVWAAFGGALIRTVKAHYRAIGVMKWTLCGRHLMTGGADGMVHTFSLVDLVDASGRSVQPIRTWSRHHLPVSSMAPVVGGRMASASIDGQVVLMEVFSEVVLATFRLPVAIHSLTSKESRLFAGGSDGNIYMVDLDEYAMYQTAQAGAIVQGQRSAQHPSDVDAVFGPGGTKSGEDFYITELKGHDRAVSAMSVLEDKGQDWLCSGDEAGVLRIWDLDSRGCVRVVQPWSHSSSMAASAVSQNNKGASPMHPITSICVVTEEEPVSNQALFATKTGSVSGREGKQPSIANLITPYQRYRNAEENGNVSVPFLTTKRDEASRSFWDVSNDDFDYDAVLRAKRRKPPLSVPTACPALHQNENTDGNSSTNEAETEIRKLQDQLAEAHSTIARWETVNHKLMAKLQSK